MAHFRNATKGTLKRVFTSDFIAINNITPETNIQTALLLWDQSMARRRWQGLATWDNPFKTAKSVCSVIEF